MKLSNTLLTEFAEIIAANNKRGKSETITYGTIEEEDGIKYVKIDGSDCRTPVLAAADTKVGERVIVMVKNHTAIVTGNLSSPAARVEEVREISGLSDDVKNRLATMEIKMDDVTETVLRHDDDIDNLQKNVLSLTDKQLENSEELVSVKDDIQLIKDTQAQQAETIALLLQDMATIKQDLEEIKGLLTTP